MSATRWNDAALQIGVYSGQDALAVLIEQTDRPEGFVLAAELANVVAPVLLADVCPKWLELELERMADDEDSSERAAARGLLAHVALRRGRLDVAEDHAAQLVAEPGEVAPVDRMNGELVRAQIARIVGQANRAVAHAEAAILLAGSSDVMVRARPRLELVEGLLLAGRLMQARSELDVLRADETELSPWLAARVCLQSARLQACTGSISQSRLLAERAMTLAAPRGLRVVHAEALIALARVETLPLAEPLLEEAMTLARACGDPMLTAKARRVWARVRRSRGEDPALITATYQSISTSLAGCGPTLEALATRLQSATEDRLPSADERQRLSGELEQLDAPLVVAEYRALLAPQDSEQLEAALDLARASGHLALEGLALRQLCGLSPEERDPVADGHRALKVAEEREDPLTIALASIALGRFWRRLDRAERAAHFDRARGLAETLGDRRLGARAVGFEALTHLQCNLVDEARRAVDRALVDANEVKDDLIVGVCEAVACATTMDLKQRARHHLQARTALTAYGLDARTVANFVPPIVPRVLVIWLLALLGLVSYLVYSFTS